MVLKIADYIEENGGKSSNGRNIGSEPINLGSTPSFPTNMIPEIYQRVINPQQTVREIKSAIRSLDRMAAKYEFKEWRIIVRADTPHRNWQ